MSNSSRKPRSKKPRKPYANFPLTANGNGQWSKKIKGKVYYFGKWEDPKGAVSRYLEVRDDLQAGRSRRPAKSSLTVKALVNSFLNFKRELRDSGELAERSHAEYVSTGKLLSEHLGGASLVEELTAEDFQRFRAKLAKKVGPVRLGNTIQRVRSVFKYGYDSAMIDKPVRFGPGFKKPSAKILRQTRLAKGPRMFSPEELRAILEHATPNIKAMVLLGINCGMGNTDCAELPLATVDLESGWLDYPRGKTAINRRIPLWPETVDAIRDAIEHRGEPKDPADKELLFIGKRGQNYVIGRTGYRVHQELQRVAKLADVKGRSFYDLRRTFETIGGASRDQVAVDSIMGHAPNSNDMAAVYRQVVEDDRLQAVTDHVRAWLFPAEAGNHQLDEEPATVRFPSALVG